MEDSVAANRTPSERTPLIQRVSGGGSDKQDPDDGKPQMKESSGGEEQHEHYSNIERSDEANEEDDDDDDDDDGDDDDEDDYYDGTEVFESLKEIDSERRLRRESLAADRLSMRLLAIDDNDVELEDQILKETLNLDLSPDDAFAGYDLSRRRSQIEIQKTTRKASGRFCTMTGLCILAFGVIIAALWIGAEFIGPPNQPVGPYELIERQEGDEFFDYYTFYQGPDSVGSNGYIDYVSEDRAKTIAIANITHETDELDVFYRGRRGLSNVVDALGKSSAKKEPFLYLKTSPTDAGPRESIRLEGKRRFNRGLFIIDVRHMPAGCGTWPAFWLTDEANWPVNGEIDIVEGVNFQAEAKTALHTTKGCDMSDVSLGTMTGSWDTAVGIPDKKTGIPDMTFREARNCFVYDPHQWLNQGCVAIDTNGGSLGVDLNAKGGGIFALEWDPVNRHIRTWVFTPHNTVPENLVMAIRSASEPVVADRVMPNPEEWPLPYGYFPIGDQTNCEGTKFKNMRLVLNTALCGSVAGNRFFLDCKNESKSFKTCNEYIRSKPDALDEAYWKIRGVYVYQREWRKAWLSK
ncbi:glycosyl hydrolase family 16 protein [Nitzschia inconspicua]|uniref:Glycosyl hydrolase family 16 protein n=1 Tax=Nitzschia inconspicua TaxID=303405 RepID=A0A9K3L850_9STRA|nr:glycosyl hydrolase family 16 protein [Nitzschia inconspicua]